MGTHAHVDKAPPAPAPKAPGADGHAKKAKDALRGQPFEAQAAALAPDGHAHGHAHGPPGARELGGASGEAAASKQAALARHAKNQRCVDGVIKRALAIPESKAAPKSVFDRKVLLRNAAQWVEAGEAKVSVLTPTDAKDQAARGVGAGKLAVFDTRVQWPGRGGQYESKGADGVDVVDAGDRGSMATDGKTLRFISPDTEQAIEAILIHEVQHDADQSFVGQRYAEKPPKAAFEGFDEADPAQANMKSNVASYWNNFKSEFRAFWLMGSTGSAATMFSTETKNGSAFNTRYVKTQPTKFKNARQEDIFWYMVDSGNYDYVVFLYAKNAAFRDMVNNLSYPASGNLQSSVRVHRVGEAIAACTSASELESPEVAAVLAAAKGLDAADRQVLAKRHFSKPFWTRAEKNLSAAALAKLEAAVAG